jgi:MarR family transcriptional regulator, organic hydroperoxide resistance regulator
MVALAAPSMVSPRAREILPLVESFHAVLKLSLARVQPALADEGITMGQFWALHTLSSHGAASVSMIARYLGVSAPTVCGNLDQLEAGGLVRRTRSVKDRREVELSVTPRGRRVEGRLWDAIGRVMIEAARDLPAADLAVASRVFRAIADGLKEPSPAVRRAA